MSTINLIGFKDIKDYEGRYAVNKNGQVYSYIGKGKILKYGLGTWGYLHYNLRSSKGTSTTKKVHRLVAETFIPNPENKRTVNHKNGIKTDNRVENLEWMTSKENMTHAYKNLLNHRKRLTDKDLADIRQRYKNGEWQVHIANSLKINQSTVSRIVTKRKNYEYI